MGYILYWKSTEVGFKKGFNKYHIEKTSINLLIIFFVLEYQNGRNNHFNLKTKTKTYVKQMYVQSLHFLNIDTT